MDQHHYTHLSMKESPTSLWMDFLFGQSLLPFLQNSTSGGILELLESFVQNVIRCDDWNDIGGTETVRDARRKKILYLKSLAFQTAAFLNWNLDEMSQMQIDSQYFFMEFVKEAFGNENMFCKTLYYRWMLRTQNMFGEVLDVKDSASAISSKITSKLELDIVFRDLNLMRLKLEASKGEVSIPSMKSIRCDCTHDSSFDDKLSAVLFLPILHFDLGTFALLCDEIEDSVAVEHFEKLNKSTVKLETPYFTIRKAQILGYMRILGRQSLDPAEETMLPKYFTPKHSGEEKVKLIESTVAPKEDQMLPGLSFRRWDVEMHQVDLRFVMIDDLRKATDPSELRALVRNIDRIKGSLSAYYVQAPSFLAPLILQLEPGEFRDVILISIMNGLQLFEQKLYVEFRSCLETTQLNIRSRIMEAQTKRLQRYRATEGILKKLDIIISWEVLLGEITCSLVESQDTQALLKNGILERCESCLKAFHNLKFSVRPRPEIVEAVVMVLINLGKYELAINCNKIQHHGWPFLEFLAVLGRACINFQSQVFFSSNFRDLWNAVLPILSLKDSIKQLSGVAGILPSVSKFKWVLDRSSSPHLVELFVSLLTKLQNFVSQEESGFIIETELLERWPNFLDEVTDCPPTGLKSARKVSGVSKLNTVLIRELLVEFLETRRGPENLHWLKNAGHVHLAAKCPFKAMRCYVEYLAVMTDSFETQNSNCWIDNLLISRMIFASYQLGAFMQATILCQFLTVPDYNCAFGHATECVSIEAWSSLCEFIWDQTILEYLINFYTKRKEYGHRAKTALNVIRQLELNAYNNQEMKEAAIRLRKGQFMRTLVNIYLLP